MTHEPAEANASAGFLFFNYTISTMNYQRNINNYTLYRFFYGMLIIGPVLTPYFRLKGLSYTEIMWLQSIAALSHVIFEMPTGVIADKVSRRLSLMLAGMCIGVAMIIYILTHSFYAFAIAEALFGLGLTFGSGADSALLYESLQRLGRENEYARIDGRSASFVFAGQGVGAIISSLLYTLNPDLPFWVSVGSAFTAAAFALRFVEVKREKNAHQYHIHIYQSFSIAIKTPRILWIVLLAALMGFASRSGFWLYEPYFTLVNIDVVWFGAIFCFFNIIAAISAKVLVNHINKYRFALLMMGVLLAVSFILPALWVMSFSIIFIGLQQIVRGAYRPTLNGYINRQIEDTHRATIISIVGLSANLSFAFFSPLVGMYLDHSGTLSTYWITGIITLTGVSLLTLIRRAQKSHVTLEAA
jgi:MFS family permease